MSDSASEKLSELHYVFEEKIHEVGDDFLEFIDSEEFANCSTDDKNKALKNCAVGCIRLALVIFQAALPDEITTKDFKQEWNTFISNFFSQTLGFIHNVFHKEYGGCIENDFFKDLMKEATIH